MARACRREWHRPAGGGDLRPLGAKCHGAKGEGTDQAPPLVGGIGSLNTDAPLKTVGSYWPYATTLYDYIHRAMPADKPQSLQPDEVYALCAYLLYLNGIVPEDAVMDAHDVAAGGHAQPRRVYQSRSATRCLQHRWAPARGNCRIRVTAGPMLPSPDQRTER